jgi:hypothetical protein
MKEQVVDLPKNEIVENKQKIEPSRWKPIVGLNFNFTNRKGLLFVFCVVFLWVGSGELIQVFLN